MLGHIFSRWVGALSLLCLLSGCFSAESTLTFHEDQTVTSKSALILERELVALADADTEGEPFCSAPGEIREDVEGGVSCAQEQTLSLSTLLSGQQAISFAGQMAEQGAEEPDLIYDITAQDDGSYLLRFDLRDLKAVAGEQATGGAEMSDEEMAQVKALVKALFVDSYFGVKVSAPKIISTNGEMLDANTARFRFSIADMFDELVVPDSFDVQIALK